MKWTWTASALLASFIEPQPNEAPTATADSAGKTAVDEVTRSLGDTHLDGAMRSEDDDEGDISDDGSITYVY